MDEAQDPEWRALVDAVRVRPELSTAVALLAARHSLDEAAAIRRLLWVAVDRGMGLHEAAAWVTGAPPSGPDGTGRD